jgi:hypothetical protein
LLEAQIYFRLTADLRLEFGAVSLIWIKLFARMVELAILHATASSCSVTSPALQQVECNLALCQPDG